jgi:hypothetical protein
MVVMGSFCRWQWWESGAHRVVYLNSHIVMIEQFYEFNITMNRSIVYLIQVVPNWVTKWRFSWVIGDATVHQQISPLFISNLIHHPPWSHALFWKWSFKKHAHCQQPISNCVHHLSDPTTIVPLLYFQWQRMGERIDGDFSKGACLPACLVIVMSTSLKLAREGLATLFVVWHVRSSATLALGSEDIWCLQCRGRLLRIFIEAEFESCVENWALAVSVAANRPEVESDGYISQGQWDIHDHVLQCTWWDAGLSGCVMR